MALGIMLHKIDNSFGQKKSKFTKIIHATENRVKKNNYKRILLYSKNLKLWFLCCYPSLIHIFHHLCLSAQRFFRMLEAI